MNETAAAAAEGNKVPENCHNEMIASADSATDNAAALALGLNGAQVESRPEKTIVGGMSGGAG